MTVTIVNKSDATGGAAVVSFRLMEALRKEGVNARMLVCEKLTDSPYVFEYKPRYKVKQAFLAERFKIFCNNGFDRKDLFKVDAASDGLPLWSHPLVKEADAVLLNWVNQGMLSLKGLQEILSTGKKVIWTMHDMWNMTGICHHAGSCDRFLNQCGDCPFLHGSASKNDLSHRVWAKKRSAYATPDARLHFVAVSNWLAQRAKESSLLADKRISVIPNAFPAPEHFPSDRREALGEFRILMGAARLDDPIKGLPELRSALEQFRILYPGLASKSVLSTFGNLRDPHALDHLPISHRHLGPVSPSAIQELYKNSDAVISTSLYETLPGTLVEGQFYGAIPVSFLRGGQGDIIDHGITGWLAQWDNDPAARGAEIARGLEWASRQDDEARRRIFTSACNRFSAQTIARAYMELISTK